MTAAATFCLAPSALAEHSVLEHVSIGSSGGNGPHYAFPDVISADGTAVLFNSDESLVPEDTDANRDLYLRRGGITTLVTGDGGDTFPSEGGISGDGTRVVFQTSDQLTPDDTDDERDIYMWTSGVTTRLSLGPSGGNGPYDQKLYSGSGFSEDGSVVVFGTFEQLVPEDTDSFFDFYQRGSGVTTLLTPGTNPPGTSYFPVLSSPSGARVFIQTTEGLLPQDTDGNEDLYERAGGTTTLLSTGPNGENAVLDGVGPSFSISRDGSHAVFSTADSLLPEDTDSSVDIYDSQNGQLGLVSTGPAGGNGPFRASRMFEVNQPFGSHGVSDDGRVFFTTQESLVGTDTDGETDLYMHADGTTTLLSVGTTGGNGPQAVDAQGISRDGSHAYFRTSESLSSEDGDTRTDLYEWANGSVRPVSPPCLLADPCNGQTPVLVAVNHDGSRVFFNSGEMLVPWIARTNTLYERHGEAVTVMPGPPASRLWLSRDGGRVAFVSSQQLVSSDTDDRSDLYTVSVGAGYARPKAAASLKVSLVPAYTACTSPNREHGPPLAFASCSPPQQSSSSLTVGTADSNGQPTRSYSFVHFNVQPGNPATPAVDEADVRVTASISDVRSAADLSDYTGELRVNASLRITDRFNASSPGGGTDPATLTHIGFPVDVQCVATPATTIGASCDVDTTLDAIVPGAVKETQRSVWQRAQTQVFDGGADGDASTGPNELFMVQGLFVP